MTKHSSASVLKDASVYQLIELKDTPIQVHMHSTYSRMQQYQCIHTHTHTHRHTQNTHTHTFTRTITPTVTLTFTLTAALTQGQ